MAKLSLNKAAPYAGVAKSTLLEALHSKDVDKKVSGEKNERGHWEIEESELDRVFGKTRSEHPERTDDRPPENHIEASILQVKLDAVQGRLEDAQATIETLRKEKDEMRTDYRQSLAVLTAQKHQEATERPKRRLFGLLRG